MLQLHSHHAPGFYREIVDADGAMASGAFAYMAAREIFIPRVVNIKEDRIVFYLGIIYLMQILFAYRTFEHRSFLTRRVRSFSLGFE